MTVPGPKAALRIRRALRWTACVFVAFVLVTIVIGFPPNDFVGNPAQRWQTFGFALWNLEALIGLMSGVTVWILALLDIALNAPMQIGLKVVTFMSVLLTTIIGALLWTVLSSYVRWIDLRNSSRARAVGSDGL